MDACIMYTITILTVKPRHQRGMQLVDVLDRLLNDRQLPTTSPHCYHT